MVQNSMKMNLTLNLTIKERSALPKMMPEYGTKQQMMLVRRILKKSEFSEMEKHEYEMQALPDGRLIWNPFKERFLEMGLLPEELTFLKELCVDLDVSGRVSREILSVVEKIDEL